MKLQRVESWFIEKSFELTAETIYGGTVRNVKRKRVPGGGSSYSKTTRTGACGRTRGWQNTMDWLTCSWDAWLATPTDVVWAWGKSMFSSSLHIQREIHWSWGLFTGLYNSTTQKSLRHMWMLAAPHRGRHTKIFGWAKSLPPPLLFLPLYLFFPSPVSLHPLRSRPLK